MISLPQKPRAIAQDKQNGVFEIERLYPGYGLTLGNALRRVLLSSLPGAAATSVRIAGVKHEFSTIPGIQEDVVEITLNLKQIRFRLHGEDAQHITLSKRGLGAVKASDFQLPEQVEIINPDQHIATITDKATPFEMELVVERGLGYQPVEERKIGKLPIGEIALDAIFTPIRKVAVEIENMRVGERTDYNRLRTVIETDGAITPADAFHQAVGILVDQFTALTEFAAKAETKSEHEEGEAIVEARETDEEKDLLKNRIESLELTTRVTNALIRSGIKTIGGLVHRSEESLLNLEGLGEGSVKEIKKELGKLGLTLKK